MNTPQFPSDFIWGAATAAYQIEGAAHKDGRGESIWDRYSHTPGFVLNGDTGDEACDHYHRWQDDIKLMQELNLQAYRFSIAWPRILPNGTGEVNQAGLDFYDRLVDGLLEANITPWVTLYHWDLPQILEDAGGWPNRATAEAFAEYTDVISRKLGDRVKNWITLNEPWCSAFLGYHIGRHAPGRTNFADALAATHTLLLGHGKAVQTIRRNVPGAKVGITLNLTHAYPHTDSAADQAAARRLDGYMNRWFLDPLYGRQYPEDMVSLYGKAVPEIQEGDFTTMSAPTDFLGINFYSPSFVKNNPEDSFLGIADTPPEGAEYTEMNWVVYPQGFRDLLIRIDQNYPVKEIYITENGAAFPDEVQGSNGNSFVEDPRRVNYYNQHIQAVHAAMEAGAPVKGYFAWSLMDNFEWGYGYSKRFGLVYVDYETQKRIPKASARWYANMIESSKETV